MSAYLPFDVTTPGRLHCTCGNPAVPNHRNTVPEIIRKQYLISCWHVTNLLATTGCIMAKGQGPGVFHELTLTWDRWELGFPSLKSNSHRPSHPLFVKFCFILNCDSHGSLILMWPCLNRKSVWTGTNTISCKASCDKCNGRLQQYLSNTYINHSFLAGIFTMLWCRFNLLEAVGSANLDPTASSRSSGV